jgi:hypothetical protein
VEKFPLLGTAVVVAGVVLAGTPDGLLRYLFVRYICPAAVAVPTTPLIAADLSLDLSCLSRNA